MIKLDRFEDRLNATSSRKVVGDGPILRIVYQQQPGRRPIRPDQVGRILKGVAKETGLDPKTVNAISGHSMRVRQVRRRVIRGLIGFSRGRGGGIGVF